MQFRLESVYDPLPLPDMLAGVLCPTVQLIVGWMFNAGPNLALCGVVGSKC